MSRGVESPAAYVGFYGGLLCVLAVIVTLWAAIPAAALLALWVWAIA